MDGLFAPLLSPDTVVIERPVALVDDALDPQERACIQHAVASRRAQFGTGRLCARRALARLGLPTGPLAIGTGGIPIWPDGCAGSITHTADYCAVAVKLAPPWRSVGVDAEVLCAVDTGILEAVTSEVERRWLRELPSTDRDRYTLLVFSAKEAYYKLQYPLTKRFLDFADVEIVVDIARGTFLAQARVAVARELSVIEGRFAFSDGKVLSALELR
jgi:4'-phosphopantetheinyl transferase EntD